jgi:hypothetical protein
MDKPKRRRMTCPICSGTGIIKENSEEYSFVTRDPQTSKCLVCNGEGFVGPRKKLPDGTEVHQLASGMPVSDRQGSAGILPAPQAQESFSHPQSLSCSPAVRREGLMACTPSVSSVPSVVKKKEPLDPSTSELLVIIIRGVMNHHELSSIISSALQPSNQIKE